MRQRAKQAAILTVVLAGAACTGESPTQPTAIPRSAAAAPGGAARAANTSPVLVWKTVPAADRSATPYPTIRGVVPLRVQFNLCPSDDVDQIYGPDGVQDPRGDSLNWQFNFGDSHASSPPLFDAGGKPLWDVDQTCRVEHVYETAGVFTAMVGVTDKHQEDQLSRKAGALARTSAFLTIDALSTAPSGSCSLDAFAYAGTVGCASRGAAQAAFRCANHAFSWTTSGDVANVSLTTPAPSVLTGLPANTSGFNTGTLAGGVFSLEVTCADASVQTRTVLILE